MRSIICSNLTSHKGCKQETASARQISGAAELGNGQSERDPTANSSDASGDKGTGDLTSDTHTKAEAYKTREGSCEDPKTGNEQGNNTNPDDDGERKESTEKSDPGSKDPCSTDEYVKDPYGSLISKIKER